MDYKRVILAGAGSGDPELLTIKALRAIEAADVVVYDRLVSEEIIALIPRGVPKIYAGKSCKHKIMPQEEINQLLITLAKKYHCVVRLKGGDPFLFGRGGEEMLALQKAGITCEIIPGITSAQGCAAAAGIPLTHREMASNLYFITGHKKDETKNQSQQNHYSLNLPQINDDTTLVVYMGISNIAEITKELLAKNLSAEIPAAIIERGTMKNQRIFTTSLINLPFCIKNEKIESPAIIIIGKVAKMANIMNKTVTNLSYDLVQGICYNQGS